MALPTLTSGSASVVEKERRPTVLQNTDVETQIQAVREFVQGALKPLIGWPTNEAVQAIRQALDQFQDHNHNHDQGQGPSEDFEIKVVNDQITIVPMTENGLKLLEEFRKYAIVSQVHGS